MNWLNVHLISLLYQGILEIEMCEFKVFLEGEKVMEDVIFARSEGNNVVLRDIVGETAIFEDVKILEVDVTTTRLILQRLQQGCPAH